MNHLPNRSEALTVAVLDDDADVTSSIASMLRRFDFHAVEFTDPGALVEDKGRFDAFVLDWLLGDTTVLALIEAIRGGNQNPGAPIFLLSGNLAVGGVPSDPELVTAIERHCLIYRAKPFSTISLARDLQESLKGVQT